ncbi:epoxide hydrolase family protein [Streptomyces sp. SID3343]|uniref:epoxide hydrolase family protein n=1 Tax=Streptomyces sp. SID3343 TaxID=2690260 RepID=UPI00136EC481|nr:epoxide hydrolase family protein [Streptomyces sp. SID3343]MYV97988.1 alpha/beta fold hydrolase [Streptomyces sp. SID3343]
MPSRDTSPGTPPPHITPLLVDIPEADLVDLRERLARTRWPDAEPVTDWSQGIPLAYTRELAEYWRTTYDWRKTEARLNAYDHFKARIDGLGIHFMHVRSRHEDATPLILTHGWPGSIIEFLDVIGPLTDPTAHGGDATDAFHLVVPSLPGYGFGDRPTETGWGIDRIARAWATLMADLGYDRYGAQGGDWGAMITASIGRQDPDHLVGIHLNMPVATPAPETLKDQDLTAGERQMLADLATHREWGTGYSRIQSTRPQTLGYGLTDSPVGQLAWIVEKFREWTDCDGHPENVLSRDHLLDNVMLYWLTGTAASSARLYWESFRDPDRAEVGAPTGCSIFPHDIVRTSRRWAEGRFTDLRYWNELERGGHFAAFEVPQVFVEEVRRFFRLVR